MSNTIVKEKKVKKTLAEKAKEASKKGIDFDLLEDQSPVVEKKKVPRKVSLKKVEPIVEKEEVSEMVEMVMPSFRVSSPPTVIFETPSIVVEVAPIEVAPIEVAPVVPEITLSLIQPEKLELFKELSKEITKHNRQMKKAAMTPEQLEEKKERARKQNAEYRLKNKDKIREKDKKYSTEHAEVIKSKRIAKLENPVEKEKYNLKQKTYKAKKRAELKESVEPKPKKERKLTKIQQRDAIMKDEVFTMEQKLEFIAALVR